MKQSEADRVRATFAHQSRFDPLFFAEYAWPWGRDFLEGRDIRAWQSEVLDTIAQQLQDPENRYNICRVAVASGHGIGKSALTGMLTTWALSCWRDPRIVITANTETQLVTKTSPEVGQWVKSSAFGDLFQVDTMSIRLRAAPMQHRADFITNSEKNPAAFAGLHAEGRLVMVIVDEASELPENIYQTILGAMTDENTILLFIMMGNPTSAHGAFREAFRKNRKFWNTWNIDSRSVEGTNKNVLQQIIDEHGVDSDAAKVRVYGQFPRATQHQFIPTPYIDAAYNRHLRQDQFDFAPVILSCDPAWDGDDTLVIGKRQGLKFDVLYTQGKNVDDMAVANVLSNLTIKHRANAVFIDFGYGTGIYSAGKMMGHNWELVKFGEAASDPAYLNKRAEMYARARDWLMEGGALPPEQRLYDDLIALATKPNPKGIIQLKSKPEMKKDNLPSTDYGDALALTFAREVTSDEWAAKVQEQKVLHGDGPLIDNAVFDPYGEG
jgi:hypothetical protein